MHRTVAARLLVPAAALLLGTGLLWGFGGGAASSSSGSPSPGAVLKLGMPSGPNNLNPFVGSETSCWEVWCLNYDQLVGFDPETLAPSPKGGLATSWEFSPDGKTCTFDLRHGVKWQDGRSFSADDVAFTYNYIVDNKMSAFTMATAGIVKAVAVDADTVKIICEEPKADLLYIWVPILPKHIWETVPPKQAGTDYVNEMPIVGTGAFQCVAFKKGNYVRMVANRDYFRGAPHLEEVVFVAYQNADTMTADLRAGNIDAAQGIPQAQFDMVGDTPGLEAIGYNYRNWNYLCFNCYLGAASKGAPILKDVRFRRALNWAIDREKLAQIAWAGFAEPGTTILPPGNWVEPDFHWQPPADTAYRYDPVEAGRLLDEAGYRDTNGDGVRERRGRPIVLRLMAGTDSTEEQSQAKLVASELKQVGITTKYEVVDPGVINDRVYSYDGDAFAPDFDMCVWAWDGYFDPGQTLNCFTTAQIEGWNEESWSNAEYDELCVRQGVTIAPVERQKIVWRMQQIMYEESPEIVLTYPRYLQAYNTAEWTGWTRQPPGSGPAFYVGTPDTYLNLRPVAVGQERRASTVWIAVAAGLAIVAIAAAWFVLRQRRRALEE